MKIKQLGIRFRPDDITLVDTLCVQTGIGNRTDVVRIALRRFAKSEGIAWTPTGAPTGTEKKR